jgi:hypothetical protein
MPHSDRLAAQTRVNAPTDRGCELMYIPVKQVSLVWPHVAGLIEAAMRRGDLSSFASVAAAVTAGCAQLWVAVARHQGVEERPSSRAMDGRTRPDADRDHEIVAAAVTKLQQAGRRKLCIIVACGGSSHEEHQGVDARLGGLCRERPGGMARWLHLLAPIEDWAKSEGCDAMRIMGRRGWGRVLPTYRLTRVVLEKEL